MKKLIFLISAGMIVLGSSCKKYLDINQNPNQPTSSTPEATLPEALVGTAGILNSYNSYGSQLVGYSANAGGYGGFGSSVTYNFGNGDFSGLWSGTYDNLNDYQYVLKQTDTLPDYGYYNAIARIMKVFDFQLLVDTYNDVPYSEALQGVTKLTPKYDKAQDIYLSLANQLDSAIATINKAYASQQADPNSNVKNLNSHTDPMFAGDHNKWLKFANTLKLRVIIRATGKVNFANTTFDKAGFLSSDAIVNPGYTRASGKQNPAYNSWAFGYDGSAGNKAWIAAKFVMGYYNGTKIKDDGRGKAIYYNYPNTATNQLGFESNDVPSAPSGNVWLSGANSQSDRGSTSGGNSVGILKGPDAGMPVMLAAESYFLQAEAAVRGLITGDAKSLFNKGIQASFNYLYLLPNLTSAGSDWDPVAATTAYLSDEDNKTNYLVNFDLATTQDQKIEAIITQKYIALNFINGQESWNEYRRTHYPKSASSTANAYASFASTQSTSTRPDKLPTRILYPTTEVSNNSANMPKGINPSTSLIFWALQ